MKKVGRLSGVTDMKDIKCEIRDVLFAAFLTALCAC